MGRPASRVCRVLMAGPLAPFAEAFSAELLERGYTPLTTVNQLRQVARLSRWLQAGGLSAADLSRERVDEFLVWQRDTGCRSSAVSRPGLVCMLVVLDGLGVLASEPPVPEASPLDLLLSSFERYLMSERGLAAGTIVGYVSHARWFLVGLERDGVVGLSAADVTGLCCAKLSRGCRWPRRSTSCRGCGRFCGSAFSRGCLRPICRTRHWWCGAGAHRCCRAGSVGLTPGRCWIPAIAAARSAGVTTR